MIKLYHRWSSMSAQQIRLALSYKEVEFCSQPLAQDDDEIWFDLGVARADLALTIPGQPVQTDALTILTRIDEQTSGNPVHTGLVEPEAWQALLKWRAANQNVLMRLYAPVLPAFIDIGAHDADLARYKAQIGRIYGMSVEALSNDRYDGFNQLYAQSHLAGLGAHLAKHKFYLNGVFSACDIVLACDLFPLQLLDGVTFPIDLMYYIKRIEAMCHSSLRDGLITRH
ncbi:MAG: glutathione S-transferase family protein [Burkholderiales bacterium]